MIRVALVEDNLDLLDEIAFNLRDEGLDVTACADGKALDRHLAHASVEVVVLDIGLPGEDGLSIARRLRNTQPHLGLIMLTARVTIRDRVLGMEEGADVYLCKPVDMRELVLVIRALVRRIGVEVAGHDAVSCVLFPEDCKLRTPSGEHMELTHSEVLLLSRLARAPGGQATRRQLIEALGARYSDYDERRLEALISRLRRKLDPISLAGESLRAVRGIGYALAMRLVERPQGNSSA